jgi:hypothetical protein
MLLIPNKEKPDARFEKCYSIQIANAKGNRHYCVADGD